VGCAGGDWERTKHPDQERENKNGPGGWPIKGNPIWLRGEGANKTGGREKSCPTIRGQMTREPNLVRGKKIETNGGRVRKKGIYFAYQEKMECPAEKGGST